MTGPAPLRPVEAEIIAEGEQRRVLGSDLRGSLLTFAEAFSSGLSSMCGAEVDLALASIDTDPPNEPDPAGDAWFAIPLGSGRDALLHVTGALRGTVAAHQMKLEDRTGPISTIAGRMVDATVVKAAGTAMRSLLPDGGTGSVEGGSRAQCTKLDAPPDLGSWAAGAPFASARLTGDDDEVVAVLMLRSRPIARSAASGHPSAPVWVPMPLRAATLPLAASIRCAAVSLEDAMLWQVGRTIDLAGDPTLDSVLSCDGLPLFGGIVGRDRGTSLSMRLGRELFEREEP